MADPHANPIAEADGPWFGVDIVDLGNPRTRGRHLDMRFMERVFGERERALVRAAPDPELAVWRHWAAKEAAFKAVGMRASPGPLPLFAHARYEVVEMGEARAAVAWQGERIAVHLRAGSDGAWVAAVGCIGQVDPAVQWAARDTEETAVHLGVLDPEALAARLRPDERRAARGFAHGLVRLAARSAIAARQDLKDDRFEIVTPQGPTGRVPPTVHLDGSLAPNARVSLSHDGSLIAWATWVAEDS